MIICGGNWVFHLKLLPALTDLTITFQSNFQRFTIFISEDIVFQKSQIPFWEKRVLKLHISNSVQKFKFRSGKQTRNQKFACNLKERVVHNRRKLFSPFTNKEPNKERRATNARDDAWPRPFIMLLQRLITCGAYEIDNCLKMVNFIHLIILLCFYSKKGISKFSLFLVLYHLK